MADPPSAPERFVADAMLGRLARWLRVLGYDTRYEPRAEDEHLVRIAIDEERWLVTRDRRLAAVHRPGLRTILIRANHHREQLREFRDCFPVRHPKILTRCLECNALLAETAPGAVAGTVPEYVLRTQSRFMRCPGCGRVYWPGSHLEGITGVLAEEGLLGPDGLTDGER